MPVAETAGFVVAVLFASFLSGALVYGSYRVLQHLLGGVRELE